MKLSSGHEWEMTKMTLKTIFISEPTPRLEG